MEMPFWDTVDRIRESGSADEHRYAREAYGFVVAALGATVQSLPADRLADPERRHLSGQELLDGVVRLARGEFGALAPTVFEEWGVHEGLDVGRIVFHLVEGGQLSARPEDSVLDFAGGPALLQRLGRSAEASAPVPAPPPMGAPGGSESAR
jgi:uncharacterized repeat protein (TIGR04138 family)